jgi:hypothetical protein
MGRQVNFFLSPDDHVALEAEIRAVGPLLIVEDGTAGGQIQSRDSLAFVAPGVESLFLCLLRPDDLGQVRISPLRGRDDGAGSIDALQSPVIECWRCYFDGTLLRRGRLYFEPTILSDQQTIENKPDPFVEWADRVLRRVRKHLTKDPASPSSVPTYFGQGALALRAQGIQMVNP